MILPCCRVTNPGASTSSPPLQVGRTVANPATCGRWASCSSPCSMASFPSMTAYLRSSSAKSRLPSTPSLSEYHLQPPPPRVGSAPAPQAHSCCERRGRRLGSISRAGTCCKSEEGFVLQGWGCSPGLILPLLAQTSHSSAPRLLLLALPTSDPASPHVLSPGMVGSQRTLCA